MAKQKTKTGNNALLPAGARTQINYVVIPKKDFNMTTHKIIIGGLTRNLAIEAFERYNAGNKWNSKYGGQRDFKIVRMKLSRV